MTKKYKHIRLPRKFIGTESSYESKSGRFIEELPVINYATQRPRLVEEIEGVKTRFIEKAEKAVLPQDKNLGELKIKFYGQPKKQMLDKYGIQVYEYQREQKAVVGTISTQRIGNQNQSDFERLEHDLNAYAQNNSLKSYFETIEDIKPLTLEEIIEADLKDFYESNPEKRCVIDISFTSRNQNSIEQKISRLSELYRDHFFSKVNTKTVHFCRLALSFTEVKKISEEYSEISSISSAPIYFFEGSSASPIKENIKVVPPEGGRTPVFIIDGSCNTNHKTIKGAVIESHNKTSSDQTHGTPVASLVICGTELNPQGDVVQKNTLINIEPDTHTDEFGRCCFVNLEEKIREIVEHYHDKFPLMILNLSINQYNQRYDGKKKSELTKVVDELSNEFNCLFCISAGNSFKGWSPEMIKNYIEIGYPDYFHLPATSILSPADSINNLSVGSLTYANSARSIAPLNHPSPITRRNFHDSPFVKPDLLHYDSNVIKNGDSVASEENGVYCADVNSEQLKRDCGTSFATPLVTHEIGLLHNLYPNYDNNSIKALMIHFAEPIPASEIKHDELKRRLTGFGKPLLDRALHSLGYASTIVTEDAIGMGQTKRIKIPIPQGLPKSSRKRMRLRKTLVYNPKIFPQDSDNYNPIKISACIIRPDDKITERELESFATRDRESFAHKKSNVKKYAPVEVQTNNGYLGQFWEIEVRCECKTEEVGIPDDYKQKYSIVLTIEDMQQDETIDIHQEISQMIDVEIPIEVEI